MDLVSGTFYLVRAKKGPQFKSMKDTSALSKQKKLLFYGRYANCMVVYCRTQDGGMYLDLWRKKDAVAQLVRAPICAFRMEACSNFINWTDNPEVAGSSPAGIPFMADIAQLGEHLLVAQGVVGSNPTVRPNYSEREVVKLVNTAVKKMIFVIKNLTAVYI